MNINYQSFLKFATSKVLADDLDFGIETYVSGRLSLPLKVKEVYTQFVTIDALINVDTVKLIDSNDVEISLGYDTLEIQENGQTKICLTFVCDTAARCVRLLINDTYYSNTFSFFTEETLPYSSLLTYWNDTDWYNLNYEGFNSLATDFDVVAQQIRLPIWYIRQKVESKSNEITFDKDRPTTIVSYSPELVYKNVYNTALTNYQAMRFALAVNSDNVYLDRYKIAPSEFSPKDAEDGADFIMTEWETQFIYENYKKIYLAEDIYRGIAPYHYNPLHYSEPYYSTVINP